MNTKELSKKYNTVIIGAGPVGCAVALMLAKRKKSILLLEANPEAAHRFAGEWLHPPGIEILKKLGLNEIIDHPDRPKGRGFVVFPMDGSSPVHLDYPNEERSLSFHHGDFVEDMRRAVEKNPSITYLPYSKVKSISQREVTYFQKTKEGELIMERVVSARRIIGADGRSSIVRKKFKSLPQGENISLMGGVLLKGVKLPCEGYGHVFLGGPGPMLVYRIGPDDVRVCIDVPLKDKQEAKNPSWIIDQYAHLFPPFFREEFTHQVLSQNTMWLGNSFRTRNFYGDSRYVFLGDAAGHTHPLTAVGITMGFLDANALVECKTFKGFVRRRTRETLIPEVLSRALYECFSRRDETAFELQKATYVMWENSPQEKKRTMALLMGEPPRLLDFATPFSKVIARGAVERIKKNINPRRWINIPKEILMLLEWIKMPFGYALVRIPRSTLRPLLYKETKKEEASLR